MHVDAPTPAEASGPGAAPEGAPDLPGWAAVAILALLAALCCTPLGAAGWFTSHEGLRPVGRVLAAFDEIADGDLYPRWISSGYLGKGMPLFDFYPPAFSLLAAYVAALGVPLLVSTKLVLYLLFLAGALGVRLWVRRHLGDVPALVAAILYLFAPYHFVDLYVRGATAEFAALAAFPFLFLGIDLVAERRSVRGLATVALASAAIVLSHVLGALMIAPFAALYALASVLRERSGWAGLGRAVAGGALGASLSAFYWLPALAERGALSAERAATQLAGYYSPFLHFVHPAQWLDPAWGFGGSAPDGFEDGMSFQVGLLLAAATLAGVLGARLLERRARGFVLLAAALGAAALALTSGASRPLYAGIEPLRLVQFPWRFLGPATLFFSAAGAGFVQVLAARRRWLGPALAAAVSALAVGLSAPQRAVERAIPLPDDPAAIRGAVAADPWVASFGNGDEYLPREASVEAARAIPGGPAPFGYGLEVGPVRAGRAEATVEVTATSGDTIAVVPWHAFPGWKVWLDGDERQLVPGPDGLLAFVVPRGRHLARVRFGTTPPRVVGWSLALAGLAALGALAIRERALGRRRAA